MLEGFLLPRVEVATWGFTIVLTLSRHADAFSTLDVHLKSLQTKKTWKRTQASISGREAVR